MQAGDDEGQIGLQYSEGCVFRATNLEGKYSCKTYAYVAGSGEHTHLGVSARLKSGKVVNLFESKDRMNQYMSPAWIRSAHGNFNNYELLNPFVPRRMMHLAAKARQFMPGIVTSPLGKDRVTPSRNRTVLGSD